MVKKKRCYFLNGDIIENKCRVAFIFQYETFKLLPCTWFTAYESHESYTADSSW